MLYKFLQFRRNYSLITSMKYIIFTYAGEGLPIAHKLQEEGQEVIVGIVEDRKTTLTRIEKKTNDSETSVEKKRRLSLYKNMINKIPAVKLLRQMKRIKDKDNYFVFFDYNNLFRYADHVKALGFTRGNFPTEKDRLFEVDRDFSKNFVKKYYKDVKIAEKAEFRTIRRGKKFLKENNGDKVWVLKGKNLWAPTFVPNTDDPELAKWQVIETLEAFKDYYEDAGFILERKIISVAEVTPERIYYDGKLLSLTINFENKQIGSGNISLQTGCAADLVFPIDLDNKIDKITFPPIIDKMAKKHKGLFIWDASLLIDKKTGDIYFGEFCPNRPGYNSFFTCLSQLPSIHYFFEKIVKKENPFELGTVGVSTTLFNLLRDPTERHLLSGASVNYTQEASKHIWSWDVYKKKKNDKMRIVGYDWQLAPITGVGHSIDEATRMLFENIEGFSLAGIYYRPKSDFLSLDYPSSILNRLRYGLQKKLYKLPFPVTF